MILPHAGLFRGGARLALAARLMSNEAMARLIRERVGRCSLGEAVLLNAVATCAPPRAHPKGSGPPWGAAFVCPSQNCGPKPGKFSR